MLLIYLLQTHYCVVPYISTLNKVCALIFSTDRKLFRTWAQCLVKCQIILLWVTRKSPTTFAKKTKTVLSCLECCIITIQVNSVPLSTWWQTQYIPMLWWTIPCVCHVSSICRSLGLCWLTPVCHVLPLVLLVLLRNVTCELTSRLTWVLPVDLCLCLREAVQPLWTAPSYLWNGSLMMYVFFSWHWWVFIPLCSWVFCLILCDLSWATACESWRYKLNISKQIVLPSLLCTSVSKLCLKFGSRIAWLDSNVMGNRKMLLPSPY